MLVPLHNSAQNIRSPDEPRFVYAVTLSLVKAGFAPTGHVEQVFEVAAVLKDSVRVSLLAEARGPAHTLLMEIPFSELWRCVVLETELWSDTLQRGVVPLVGENIGSWIPCLSVQATSASKHLRQHLVELWLDGKAGGLILRGSAPVVLQYAGRDADALREQHVLLPLHEVPITAAEIRSVHAGQTQPRLSPAGMAIMTHEEALLAALPSSGIPAKAELSDNGATTGVSKTMLGAIPGTKRAATSGFAVADDSTLDSKVTYLFVYYRCGVDGKLPTVRRKHVLQGALCNIGSEGEDVYCHGQAYHFAADVGRVCIDALKPGATERTRVRLHMSANNLGWYWIEPITDSHVIRELLIKNKESVTDVIAPTIAVKLPSWCAWPCTPEVLESDQCFEGLNQQILAPINPHTGVSMNRPAKLNGYEMLCRMHVVLGHPGLATMLHTLGLMKHTKGMISKEDVEKFVRRKCGLCESMLMNTPAFRPSTTLSPAPEPGQVWTRDTLKFRVAQFHLNSLYVTGYSDKASGMWVLIPHLDYTAETVIELDQKLRTFVRPINGEIMRIKSDNHPSYKAKETFTYLAEAEIGPQFSPVYGHQMVGEAEVIWRYVVPRANALLKGCPTDNGEEHEIFAMFTATAARNDMIPIGKTASPSMVFHRLNEPVLESQVAFGAPCKFLKYPEQRDSKFEEHATAGSFRGPSRETLDVTPKLCYVLTMRNDGRKVMSTVHMGTIRVDERPVIARTTVSHPSHQPFGDASVEHATDLEPEQLDFSTWRDVATEGYAPDATASRPTHNEAPVPRMVWQPSCVAPNVPFVVGICGGAQGYANDLCELTHKLSDGQITYFSIDLQVGGHGHNITLPRILASVGDLLRDKRCAGAGFQPDCKAVSALLCLRPGPVMVFTRDEKNGVRDLEPADAKRRDDALALYNACAHLARHVCHDADTKRDKFVWWESPVGRGAGSPFAIVGQESHSPLFDMDLFVELANELRLQPVYVDQGSAGADAPKTTAIYGTPNIIEHLDALLGALPLAVPSGGARTVGFDEQGVSKAKGLAKYPLELRARLACAMVRCARRLRTPATTVSTSTATPSSAPLATAPAAWAPAPTMAMPPAPAAPSISVDADVEQPTPVPTRGRRHRPDLVSSVPRFSVEPEPASDVPSVVTNVLPAGRAATIPEIDSSPTQQDILLEFQKAFPPKSRVDVQWDEPVTIYGGVIVGKGRLDTTGKAMFQVLYDEGGEKFWHNIDDTRVTKPLAQLKTLVVEGERVTELTDDRDDLVSGDVTVACLVSQLKKHHTELLVAFLTAVDGVDKHDAEALRAAVNDDGCEEGVHNILFPLMDVETGEIIQVVSAVVSNGKEAVTIDPNLASRYDVPQTYKQYKMSPHKAFWRTAMELKMEAYEAVPVWTVVSIKKVPRSTRIFRLKWVFVMKAVPGSEKLKFAPRLCLVGTNMDPAQFPSFADVGRKITLKIITAVFAAHMEEFTSHQADDSDAFQNTIVDGSDGDKPNTMVYSYQAPDFETKSDNGETLVLEHRTAFQGRIDSPRLYAQKVRPLLIKAGFHPLMHDPEGFIYNEGPGKGTSKTLPEILQALKTAKPAPPGHAPNGYALMVRHVDDKVMIVTSLKIMDYMVETLRVAWVCKYTGWRKVLGWDAVIDRDDRTITFECPAVLVQAKRRFLKGDIMIAPKHVTTPSIMDIAIGEVPPEGHPDRPGYLAMQSEGSSLLGLMIWLTENYTQALFLTRWVGRTAHCLSPEGVKFLKYALMHLVAHPYATHWGGTTCRSLELSTPIKQPYSSEDQEWGLYFKYDANLSTSAKSMTGVVGMLAGGAIDNICQSQQCKAGETHTTEVVAGGTALNRIITARGLLQEMHYPSDRPTPTFTDSATSIFVANDDGALKRALWLRRRVLVLRDGVDEGEFEPIKIPEEDNAADVYTKYLVFQKWKRHTDFINNMNKQREDKAIARMALVNAAYSNE